MRDVQIKESKEEGASSCTAEDHVGQRLPRRERILRSRGSAHGPKGIREPHKIRWQQVAELWHEAFEGYDEPVNIDMDPEEALKLVMDVPEAPPEDLIEPVLDD